MVDSTPSNTSTCACTGLQLPGNHTLQWDGRNQSGQPVAAGTYFYQLQAGEARQAGKVLLVR